MLYYLCCLQVTLDVDAEDLINVGRCESVEGGGHQEVGQGGKVINFDKFEGLKRAV